jgi:hypothetical protein
LEENPLPITKLEDKLQVRLIKTSFRGLRSTVAASCPQVGGLMVAFVRLIMTSVQRLEEKQPPGLRINCRQNSS